jgi:hypothetical protein
LVSTNTFQKPPTTFERHTSRVAEVFVDVTEVEKEEGKV